MAKAKRGNRFTSKTGTYANLIRQINRLQDKVDYLRKENSRLEESVSSLSKKLKELENFSSNFLVTLYNKDNISPILKSYVDVLKKNVTREPKGYRYQGLKEFFTLLSFMGPHYYGILNSNMIFPSYRRTLDYKKFFLGKYQITDDIYNGCIENILKIKDLFLPPDFDGKAVVMIDATAVTPYVMVDENGTVEGLIDCNKLPENEVRKIIDDEGQFCNFINMHADYLIQAEFGISMAPLDPKYPQFPIACIQATSGKATLEIVYFIEKLISELRSFVNVIGLATDGDDSYNKYSHEFMDRFIQMFNRIPDMSVVQIINEISVIMHFSDPFHLVKRDRYRKVSIFEFCISPLNLDRVRNVKDLEDVGIPAYILDNNKGRKMEDDLPKKLFSLMYIQKIIEKGDIDLLISMLPSTLFMESLHSKNLSRQSTIDYLLFGCSIVIIYLFLSCYVIENQNGKFKDSIGKHYEKMCFTTIWCEQYIFTTICIASLLYTEKSIDLGACGSHYQEHNFANVKRHNKKDDSHMKFMKSMKYILLEKILYKQLSLEESVPNSRSDSGRKIYDDEKVVIRPFGWYLSLAKRLWSNITTFPKDSILSTINSDEPPMTMHELMQFLGTFSVKVNHSISTKSTGMIKTGGLNNAKIWNAIKQMEDLLDDDDSE